MSPPESTDSKIRNLEQEVKELREWVARIHLRMEGSTMDTRGMENWEEAEKSFDRDTATAESLNPFHEQAEPTK